MNMISDSKPTPDQNLLDLSSNLTTVYCIYLLNLSTSLFIVLFIVVKFVNAKLLLLMTNKSFVYCIAIL